MSHYTHLDSPCHRTQKGTRANMTYIPWGIGSFPRCCQYHFPLAIRFAKHYKNSQLHTYKLLFKKQHYCQLLKKIFDKIGLLTDLNIFSAFCTEWPLARMNLSRFLVSVCFFARQRSDKFFFN